MTKPSPYLLPDGNVQIAFSGGRTSAYMLHHLLEANGSLPDQAAWWERMEALASDLSNAKGQTPGRGAWFSKRYTRREMREFMERQGDWALSTEGVLCQADDGECMA